MALPGHMDKWKEIINELKECGVEYTVRKIRPRVNIERTGWNKPYADGMLGQHPKHEETEKFAGQYYSAEEEDWLKQNV